MPEGDSVFRLAARLRRSLDGRTLERGDLRVPAHATDALDGMRLMEHATHGKHLLTRFDNGQTLHTHLRMDGSWSVVRPGKTLPRALDPDIRVLLAAEGGPTAYGLLIPIVELAYSTVAKDEASRKGGATTRKNTKMPMAPIPAPISGRISSRCSRFRSLTRSSRTTSWPPTFRSACIVMSDISVSSEFRPWPARRRRRCCLGR